MFSGPRTLPEDFEIEIHRQSASTLRVRKPVLFLRVRPLLNQSSSTFKELHETAARVRRGARVLAHQSTATKNGALAHVADALRAAVPAILAANQKDLARGREKALDRAFLDRLELNPERIEEMVAAIEEVIALPDPVGRVDAGWVRPNGLRVGKRRIPLGVIGIIYESRPNVTSDATALCLKSGNGVILKGGSDAFESNRAIYAAIRAGLKSSSLPAEAAMAVGFVDTTERAAVGELLKLEKFIDVIIPRGGHTLIRYVTEHSLIPVIKHDQGICHGVVDGSARAEVVDAVILNSKVARPGVCNAMETLLVLENAAETHLPRLLGLLADEGVRLHLCPRSLEAAKSANLLEDAYLPATEDAFLAEYLSLELAVAVLPDLSAAIAHIQTYGSNHTEILLSEDYSQIERFQREVDSSVLMINASSRFSDGGQLGLGAEIGISTSKMHAYGPMGIDELTSTKFVVLGEGQIRS